MLLCIMVRTIMHNNTFINGFKILESEFERDLGVIFKTNLKGNDQITIS